MNTGDKLRQYSKGETFKDKGLYRDLLKISIYNQCLSQDLETGCLKLAVLKLLGVQIFKGDHNILIFQPQTCINSSK